MKKALRNYFEQLIYPLIKLGCVWVTACCQLVAFAFTAIRWYDTARYFDDVSLIWGMIICKKLPERKAHEIGQEEI